MSVISSVLTKDYLIVASDSILTFEVDGQKIIDEDSYSKAKFVAYSKLKCIASYWGLAYIKVGDKKVWKTYEWLESKIDKQNTFNSIEDFGIHLKNELEEILKKYKFNNPLQAGIGIHLVCFESHNNKTIPELFLLPNFTNPSYNVIGQLGLSRRTYGDLLKGEASHDSLIEQREYYYKILCDGGFSYYNNGDPILFNNFANSYHTALLIAKKGKNLKGV